MRTVKKILHPLEVILVSEQEVLINKANVFDMNDPSNPITINNATEDVWTGSGEPLSISESMNKIFIRIKKETTPQGEGNISELVYDRTFDIEQPPDSGNFITRTRKGYFKLGAIYSAIAEVDSDFPSSDDETVIIEVAEISFDPLTVSQIAMSDIWLLNPLLWYTVDDDDSDSDDSDSDNGSCDSS